MKSLRWTIWILGVLLIAATLDSLPDPPAVKSTSTVSTALAQPLCVSDAAAQLRDSLANSVVCVGLVSAHARQPYRPSHRSMLTAQAGDPSPPAEPSGRKQFLQS